MTLNEAIRHYEEAAKHNYHLVDIYHTDEGVYLEEETKARERAEEYERLAEWLKELRTYRKREEKATRKRCPMV